MDKNINIKVKFDNAQAIKGVKQMREIINSLKAKGVEGEILGTYDKITQKVKKLSDGTREITKNTQKIAKIRQVVGQTKEGKDIIRNVGMPLGSKQSTVTKLPPGGKALKDLTSDYDSFGKVMGMPFENWKKINKEGGKFKTIGANAANSVRQLTHGMRGFRMEALGVMFFGMAITRFFQGLLKPALDVVGVFDLLNTTLSVVFLPVATLLMEALLPIMNWFMSLPESVKLAIGVFALIAIAIGAILTLVGALILGFGALIVAFAAFASPIGVAAIAAIGVGLAALGPILALIGAAVVAFALLWQTNLGGIQTFLKQTFGFMWTIVKDTFGKVWTLIKDVWGVITAILSGDWGKAWAAVVDILKTVVMWIIGTFIRVAAMIGNSFAFAINFIKDLLVNVLVGGMTFAISKLLDLLGLLPGEAGEIFRNASKAVTNWQSNLKNSGPLIPYIQQSQVEGTIGNISGWMDSIAGKIGGNETNVNITVNAPNDYAVLTRQGA